MRGVVEIYEGSFGLGELSGDGGYTVIAFLKRLEARDDVVDLVVDLEEGV
jgi:hypothetical protein